METKKYTCDIKDCKNDASVIKQQYQVVFITEQTEGRIVKPYFSFSTLDLCQVHVEQMLNDKKYIKAEGAQGFNKYWI